VIQAPFTARGRGKRLRIHLRIRANLLHAFRDDALAGFTPSVMIHIVPTGHLFDVPDVHLIRAVDDGN